MADWLDRVVIRWKRGTLPEHYRDTFGTASGNIVLADLARECGLLATSEGLDMQQTMFVAGKRHVMTHILAKLRYIPRDLNALGNVEIRETEP